MYQEESCYKSGPATFDLTCGEGDGGVTRVIIISRNLTYFGKSDCHTEDLCCPRSTDQCKELVADTHPDHWEVLSDCNGLQECKDIPKERILLGEAPCINHTDYETVTYECVPVSSTFLPGRWHRFPIVGSLCRNVFV